MCKCVAGAFGLRGVASTRATGHKGGVRKENVSIRAYVPMCAMQMPRRPPCARGGGNGEMQCAHAGFDGLKRTKIAQQSADDLAPLRHGTGTLRRGCVERVPDLDLDARAISSGRGLGCAAWCACVRCACVKCASLRTRTSSLLPWTSRRPLGPRTFPILAMLRRLHMRAPASALLEHAPSAFPRAWPYSRIKHIASDVGVSFALITETGAPPTDSGN